MFIKFISLLADFSILIPFLIFIIRGADILLIANKIILGYISLMLLRNIITSIMAEFSVYNIYLYNWHNLINFTLITLLYYYVLQKRNFKLIAFVFIFIATLIPFLDYQSLFDTKTIYFNRFSYNISGCLAIILILLFFYELIQNLQVPELKSFPLFWFSAGVLFYYSGTVFSYLFIKDTFNNLEARNQYWLIDSLLSIVLSIFLSLTVWYMKPIKPLK
ncbi:MAG: hypothetical protein R2822_17605 [Spirosomataceae bacterium]